LCINNRVMATAAIKILTMLTNNINQMWALFTRILVLILVVLFMLIQGSVPFVFVLGSKLVILLIVSFCW
jgi:hypothetical protein